MKALPRAEDGVAFEDGVLTLTDGREIACRGGARAGRQARSAHPGRAGLLATGAAPRQTAMFGSSGVSFGDRSI
jgi:hypothetical protein